MLHFGPPGSKPGLKAIAAIAGCSLGLYGAVPEGWFLSGSRPAAYEVGVDSQAVYNGRSSAYLKYVSPKEPASGDVGTFMQQFSAKQYNGQRVRFSAYVKSEVVEWAGLWMRVDRGEGISRKTVSFDNMHNRPIKGTTGWQLYEVVLDVPENSGLIALGILVGGKGTLWLNSANFEVVSKAVPLTGPSALTLPDGPVNLSLTQ